MVKRKSNRVKIVFCVIVMLVAAMAVFLGAFLSRKLTENKRKDYTEIRVEVLKLTDGRKAVEKFLNLEIKTAKLNDADKKIVDDFEEAVPEDGDIQTLLQKVLDINEEEDEGIKKAVDAVALTYIGLHSVYLLEQDLAIMFDGELSDEDLAILEKSENDYLAKLAKEVGDYRTKVKGLSAKDDNFEQNCKLLEEEGEKLQKKYAEVKLKDIMGKTEEDIMEYYDKVEELNTILLEYEQK
ncbi:MAG: hypothetical protein K5837_02800 [Candidatus Saccharibacteria bacterium]|nr:hypothetical protein [Candidatus Saccharibacteria bacterium]